jgi:pyruvate ferredoxin oxidoreductase gamma subunit
MLEIVFHGRGGQGAKSAGMVYANGCLLNGNHIEAFPEYGAERAGAPIRSFLRVSDDPITIHSAIENPDIAIVLDETLLSKERIAGLKEDGILIVNCGFTKEEVLKKTKFKGDIYVIDGNNLSLEIVGRKVQNVPVLGVLDSLVKKSGYANLVKSIDEHFSHKLKKEILDKNILLLKKSYLK